MWPGQRLLTSSTSTTYGGTWKVKKMTQNMIKSSIRTEPRRNEEPFRDSFHQATVVSFLSHKRAWTNITGEVLWLSQTRRNNGVYCHHHWLITLLWPGLSLSWRLSNNHAWKYLELMCAHWDRKQERLSWAVSYFVRYEMKEKWN